MVVRSWSELDFDNVCSNAKVFGFDLDNTLASSIDNSLLQQPDCT